MPKISWRGREGVEVSVVKTTQGIFFRLISTRPFVRFVGPARATAMYNEMCLGANRNPSHTPCMCDFLWTVEEGIFDMPSYRGAEIPCINSTIDTGDYKYPCQNVVLLSMVGLIELLQGGDNEEGSDCWGWTASTGEEIAMIGLESMVGFVDITDPVNPIYLGRLPARGNRSYWRDIKVYGDYAFIVSENNDHGMQVRWAMHH